MAESLDSLGISIRGVRESNMRLAYREGLTIEQAADSIIKLATDEETRIRAHIWKIYSIPVIRQIFGQSDPLLSSADALAFSIQCRDYFATGLGKGRFGAYQQIAINAVSVNEQMLIGLNRQRFTSVRIDTMMVRLSRWAAAHPLTNHVFDRPSVLGDLDTLLAYESYSIGSAVGRIADDVDDLSGRISLLSAQLPREARWQAEYLLADLELKERLRSLDTTVAVLTNSLTRVENSLRAGDIVVDIASLRSLHSDIQAALDHVSSERAIVVSEVERIRLATLLAAEEAVDRAVAAGLVHAEAIVDRVLLKIGGFLVVVFLGGTLFVLSIRRFWRRGA